MKLDPNQVFLAILRYVPAIVVVVLSVIFIFSFKIVIITNEMERTNIEIAENIFSSDLTYDRAVFDMEKLDAMIQRANTIFGTSDKEPNIEPEQTARHCRIGYKAEIEDLKDGKKWAFGYVPFDGKDAEEFLESRMTHDAAIYVKGKERGYEDAHPARLTLTLRETWLSRIGCMIEEAYEFKEPRTTQVPCIFEEIIVTQALDRGNNVRTKFCGWEVKRSDIDGKHICLYKQKGDSLTSNARLGEMELVECRYFPKDINVADSSWLYEKSEGSKRLTVYPLGSAPAEDLKKTCGALERKEIESAKEDEEVKAVIICIK